MKHFANAIRRVFNDELYVKCLDSSIFDIKTDDKYILPDTILERINQLSLYQSIPDNLKFSLNVINNTNDSIKIYSNNIKNANKNDNNKYFNQNILLCTLKSNKYLVINNITIKKNNGINNNNYSLGSFCYKSINTDFNTLSLNNNNTDFELELILNIVKDTKKDLEYLINSIYDNLYIRLKNIQTKIENYIIEDNSTFINKIIHDLFIINKNNIYEIHINNEYHTIGNILTKYVYQLDKNIELINYKLEHPLRYKIIVNIKHSNYKKIINDAIDNSLSDLLIFKSELIKFISNY
jgi:DNA-directed RNA polymerase subunit L